MNRSRFTPWMSIASTTQRFLWTSAAVALAVVAATQAQAAPVVTEPASPSNGGANTNAFTFSVSSTDLLQTQLAGITQSGTFNTFSGGGGPAILANGVGLLRGNSYSDGNATDDFAETVFPATGATATFTLDTSVNTLGYNITQISTYGGWNDLGRDRQTFTIQYSTVADPGTFLTVDSIDHDGVNADGGAIPIIADFTVSLTNVKALKWVWGTQETLAAAYAEFDVLGTPVTVGIPEPGSFTLCYLGAMGLFLVARRRKG